MWCAKAKLTLVSQKRRMRMRSSCHHSSHSHLSGAETFAGVSSVIPFRQPDIANECEMVPMATRHDQKSDYCQVKWRLENYLRLNFWFVYIRTVQNMFCDRFQSSSNPSKIAVLDKENSVSTLDQYLTNNKWIRSAFGLSSLSNSVKCRLSFLPPVRSTRCPGEIQSRKYISCARWDVECGE
jgi:hypothetical protein